MVRLFKEGATDFDTEKINNVTRKILLLNKIENQKEGPIPLLTYLMIQKKNLLLLEPLNLRPQELLLPSSIAELPT